MKKILLSLVFIFLVLAGRSQGLERIVVEKYYVSDANDAAGSSGILPVGSVTWRIYADMAPGWYLLQVFGNQNINHPLLMTTTTSFFNDPDYGTYTPSNSSNNTKPIITTRKDNTGKEKTVIDGDLLQQPQDYVEDSEDDQQYDEEDEVDDYYD